MDFLLEALTNWLKEMLVGGIMSNLSGMFDSVNQQVTDISGPTSSNPGPMLFKVAATAVKFVTRSKLSMPMSSTEIAKLRRLRKNRYPAALKPGSRKS